MQDDPHNLLIISRDDQLDHDQTFKDAIINDSLLPLLNDQNENLLTNTDNDHLNILNKQTEFTYDTLKQLEQNCHLLPTLQSALEQNLVNLMNNTIVNSATLNRQQQFNQLNSPCKSYISPKSALDNGRIIYSTITNTIQNPIELNNLNNSIAISNNTIQLNDNQSADSLLTNSNANDLIEMSINSPTIYTMNMVMVNGVLNFSSIF